MIISPISSCPFHTNYFTQHLIRQIPGALSLVVKWPGCQADHSPPSSIEVKHEWNCTSTPPICLHGVHKGNIFLFNFPNLLVLNLPHGICNLILRMRFFLTNVMNFQNISHYLQYRVDVQSHEHVKPKLY